MYPIYISRATSDSDLPPPRQETEGAAGYDLRAIGSWVLPPNGVPATIPTGWCWQIPRGWVGVIRDRSGLALAGVTVRAGVVDSDYRGEVRVVLANTGPREVHIQHGERIAQMLILPCLHSPVVVVGELESTKRGSAGFGSTGSA